MRERRKEEEEEKEEEEGEKKQQKEEEREKKKLLHKCLQYASVCNMESFNTEKRKFQNQTIKF